MSTGGAWTIEGPVENKLTGVAQNDDFQESLVVILFVGSLGHALTAEVFNLVRVVVVAQSWRLYRRGPSHLVDEDLVGVDLEVLLADASGAGAAQADGKGLCHAAHYKRVCIAFRFNYLLFIPT